jgi:hypothetical protein
MTDRIKSLYRFISDRFQTVHLDYKVQVRPRTYGGSAAHPLITEIIQKNTAVYQSLLSGFLSHTETFSKFKEASAETDPHAPVWNNNFLPGLDIVSIYGMIVRYKPQKYIEIGSGNSTKVAHKAIQDFKLNTRITSIDPYPRAEIDQLAHHVIRKPLENLENLAEITDNLNAGDILFIDNSHRSFPNSDVTVCFLELLPYLKKGVIVHVHDIYLPYDYPQEMCDRFYNEQYMLAPYIIANPEKYSTLLPCFYISKTEALSAILDPLWDAIPLKNVERHGGGYWIQIGE